MDPELLATVRRLAMPEDDAAAAVRARAEQVVPIPPVEVGSLLHLLGQLVDVRHAVEIGAAGGVTGAWLVAAMGGRGVLTSIEADAHLHGVATTAFDELGISDRVRAILGDPATVVDRLSDDQYELVLLQHDPEAAFALLPDAARLLRPGGLFVARRVLAHREVAPADLLEAAGSPPWSAVTVLPIDDGLLVARLAAG